ncbi:ABC transporter substrate-binding protein, partial [Glycomyces paridis]
MPELKRPFRIAAALAAVSALALTACSTPSDDESVPGVTDDTVVIGTHQPLTGPAAAGYSTISAATAAYFEYVNAGGGIHGRSIEYIVKDDGYDPATTQTAVREL